MKQKRIHRILLTVTLMWLSGCSTKTSISVIQIGIDKATIPEGIVIDPKTKEIYLSSVHLNKITKSDKFGKNSIDVIKPNELGYAAGVGMEIKGEYLFALGSIKGKDRSQLLQIKIKDDSIVQRYVFRDTTSYMFNDLAVDNALNAYITDTKTHKIYKLNATTQEIELFLEDEQIKYPNGITVSEDETKLFIDSYTSGIRIVDIKTKRILNAPHQESSKRGIDGLKYDKGKLYAIINGGKEREKHGLVSFSLNDKEDDLIGYQEILLNHEKMDVPTTLSIVDDVIYLIANSQMDNLDQDKNEIINPDILKDVYIIQVKL